MAENKPTTLNFGNIEGMLQIRLDVCFREFEAYPADFWAYVQRALEGIPEDKFPKGLPAPKDMVATFASHFECNGLYDIMRVPVSKVILTIKKPRNRYGLLTYNTSPFDRIMVPDSYWSVQLKRINP